MTIKHLMVDGFGRDILSCEHSTPYLVTGRGHPESVTYTKPDGSTEVVEATPYCNLSICPDCGMLLIEWQRELGQNPVVWGVHPTLIEMTYDAIKAKNAEKG